MKAWIETKTIGAGTEEDPKKPYTANQSVNYSILDLGDNTCLCRVTGTPEQINTIIADSAIAQPTDNEARTIIKSKYPDSDLENMDIADSEVDEIAKAQGLDPKLRADIIIPTRGKQLLQDQEQYLMKHICEKISLTRDYWDTEASKTTKWAKGIDIEHDILDGKTEAHSFVLDRIRAKITATK